MPAESTITLSTPLSFLPSVGPGRAKRLEKLGLRTARDVLFLFPKDYEFPAPPSRIDAMREGEPASIVGHITDAELAGRTPGKSIFGILIENESGALRCTFFNQPFRAETLKVGQRVLVSGIPKLAGLRLEFVHPKVVLLGDDERLPQAQILPLYPLTDGVKQIDLRRLSRECIDTLADQLTEAMPESLRHHAADELRQIGIPVHGDLPGIASTIGQLHYPDGESALLAARSRLIFQELVVMQLALAMRRRQLTSDLLAPPLPTSPLIDARIVNRFPFSLTEDQRRVMTEVAVDMGRQFPMNRMLQGDVGSGKTVVALYAILLAIANGHQAVFMAPTEVLARQHFHTIKQMLRESRVRIGLLYGSLGATERRETKARVASGEIDLLIGTQALVYGEIQFSKLGLCVIDEQHKFGVSQRVALRQGGIAPHCLVMSATPIPRSLAMTLFGDVDLSSLREKPPGRGKVHTYLAHDGWKERWWQFVEQQLSEGRQAFVVAPRINADEVNESGLDEVEVKEDVSSVLEVYERLRCEVFPNRKVGLLHGKLSPDDKAAVMKSFANGSIDVLVSTTVIEVGIDVPNATVLTILGAQRFGLAQLHQLRGRVSRGVHAGHVCVFTDGEQSPSEYERLKVLEQTQDGFELAEADFRLRGPGELIGRKQSGMPPMKIADLHRDQQILLVARSIAQAKLDDDPQLSDPQWAELRSQMFRRYGQQLQLGDVA